MDNNWKVNVVIFWCIVNFTSKFKSSSFRIKHRITDEKLVIIMQQRGEHFWFLVAIHGWKISVLELYKNLVLVFSSPPVFTLSWGKIITIIYLACCQLRVFLLMDASCQAVNSCHPINWFEIWMKFSHYLDNLPNMIFIFLAISIPFKTVNTTWTLKEIRN